MLGFLRRPQMENDMLVRMELLFGNVDAVNREGNSLDAVSDRGVRNSTRCSFFSTKGMAHLVREHRHQIDQDKVGWVPDRLEKAVDEEVVVTVYCDARPTDRTRGCARDETAQR